MSTPPTAPARRPARWFALGAATVVLVASGAGLALAAEGDDEDPSTTTVPIESTSTTLEAPATTEVPPTTEAPPVAEAPEGSDDGGQDDDGEAVARSAEGCPDGTAYESHGAYVSEVARAGGDVPAAARSDCGKPVHAVDAEEPAEDVEAPDEPDDDAEQGPPADRGQGRATAPGQAKERPGKGG